jgi:sodium transport system permease protein
MPASPAKTIRLIARKELLDLLRDRRTIITALLVPLVSFPILFGIVGYFASPVSNPSQVAMVNLDGGGGKMLSTNLTALVFEAPGIHVRMFQPGFGITNSTQANAAVANLTRGVKNGEYDVGLVIPENFSVSITRGGQSNVTLFYVPTNGRAQEGVSIVNGIIAGISQNIASQRLQVKNITNADLNPIGVSQSPVGASESQSQLLSASLFPSFLLYFTFLGGFYFMVDDIAGEKERRSLEPLLALPTSRAVIFTGKYLVAFLLSMVTASLGLVGTVFALTELSTGTGGGSSSTVGISIPIGEFPSIFGVVALAALSLSALGFCISTFSKNIREAQQYLSPVFFIFFIPIYFTSYLPQNQISQYAAIPLMGYVVLLRDVIVGQATTYEILLSTGVNLVVLLLFIWLGLRLLNSEKVILRAT